jgi:hypothetical protein
MKVGFKQRRGNVGLVVQILDAATVVVGVAMLQNTPSVPFLREHLGKKNLFLFLGNNIKFNVLLMYLIM